MTGFGDFMAVMAIMSAKGEDVSKVEVSSEFSGDNIDAELEQLLAKQKATIKVVGTGGGGKKNTHRNYKVGIGGEETIAISTDAKYLLYKTANKKILIGREIKKGLGAGSEPRLGEES